MCEDVGTIAAISTPIGIGGIGMVKISGGNAIKIAANVFRSYDGTDLMNLVGYRAKFGRVFYRGDLLDEAVALVFRTPKSFTGEDVVEITCHGGILIVQKLLRAIFEGGARLANPGEFSFRAFKNGKMSLEKAESIMEMISAASEKMMKISLSVFEGTIGKEIESIRQKIIETAAGMNATIDYPEEDISEIDFKFEIKKIIEKTKKLSESAAAGKIFKNGVKTAIIGTPNVGKSTLMNLLVGRERSIVTDIPGTTRDVIEETVVLGKIPLILEDTAGIRKANGKVEKIGVERAIEVAKTSELIFIVLDASRRNTAEEDELIKKFDEKKVILILNKTDLGTKNDRKGIRICAKTGEGTDELKNAVNDLLGTAPFENENMIITNERQLDVLNRTLKTMYAADNATSLDVCADLLAESARTLREFGGENVDEEIIEKIFSKFCVGK
jgi:tRNA modification GTPase